MKQFRFLLLTFLLCLFMAAPMSAHAATNWNGWEWQKDGDDYKYINEKEKSFLKNQFATIKGHTYYFDKKGHLYTGWLRLGKDTYFFDANGYMLSKTWKDNSYYFLKNGKMAVNRWVNKVYVGSNGKAIPGYRKNKKAKWVKTSQGRRYRNWDGTYTTKSWQCINNHWYYFNSRGIMVTKTRIGRFYVGADGKMYVNRSVKIKKYRYYYGADGRLIRKVKVSKK